MSDLVEIELSDRVARLLQRKATANGRSQRRQLELAIVIALCRAGARRKCGRHKGAQPARRSGDPKKFMVSINGEIHRRLRAARLPRGTLQRAIVRYLDEHGAP